MGRTGGVNPCSWHQLRSWSPRSPSNPFFFFFLSAVFTEIRRIASWVVSEQRDKFSPTQACEVTGMLTVYTGHTFHQSSHLLFVSSVRGDSLLAQQPAQGIVLHGADDQPVPSGVASQTPHPPPRTPKPF